MANRAWMLPLCAALVLWTVPTFGQGVPATGGVSFQPASMAWVDPPEARVLAYRRALLVSDGAAMILGWIGNSFVMAETREKTGAYISTAFQFAPLLGTGPIVHLTRRKGFRALASLGTRVLFYSGGMALGTFAASACRNDTGVCGAIGYGASLSTTMSIAMLIDAYVYTSEMKTVGRSDSHGFYPMVAVDSVGALGGVGGVF